MLMACNFCNLLHSFGSIVVLLAVINFTDDVQLLHLIAKVFFPLIFTGIWYGILRGITYIGIITNVSITIFLVVCISLMV